MSTVMMSIEGVLGDSEDFRVTMQPIDVGLRLYVALTSTHRVVLATSEHRAQPVDHWLASNGIRDYATVMCSLEPEFAAHIDVRQAQLRALRASRTAVTLVVDADPLVVAHAMSVGVTGLLFGRPRPGAGRADLGARTIRDWSAIEAEVETQRAIRQGADQ